jgi:hypothetical protein
VNKTENVSKKIIIQILTKSKRLCEKNTRIDEKNTHDMSVVLGTIENEKCKRVNCALFVQENLRKERGNPNG